MNFIKNQLLGLLLPLLLGPLTSFLSRQALNLNIAIDRLKPEVKQAVVFVVGLALTTLAQKFLPGLCADIANCTLETADWQIFATWVVGLIWHDNKKKAKR